MLLWNGEAQILYNFCVDRVLLIFLGFSLQLFCKFIVDENTYFTSELVAQIF